MVPAFRRLLGAAVATALAAGCSTPAPAEKPPPAVAVPPAPAAAIPPPSPLPPLAAPGPRLAPRDAALEHWKRQAAERIHAANTSQLFEGRPHHLLQGVIVADVTVDRGGRITRSRIVRSPGLPHLDRAVQASLRAASQLPAPPAALTAKGPLTYSETWLFANDGRWRLRTLALPQE